MVTEKYYSPGSIFNNLENSPGMVGQNNNDLAKSFFHARYNNDGSHCSAERADQFDRNAGAVQLYKKGGIEIYPTTRDKEYHFVSYGNKDFKDYTKRLERDKRSSYGHSERFLMWKILDDLLSDDPESGVPRPSELFDLDGIKKEYEVLKRLTDKPEPYKKYLEQKGIIIKMWSERPACKEGDLAGGDCSLFIRNIFPEGSQFGFIVKDYTRADNVDPQKIITASNDLKDAYFDFKKESMEKKSHKRDSSPSVPVSESKKTRTE